MSEEVTFIDPEWVQKQVEAVRAKADDDEVAHGMEDDLHHQVLQAIALERAVEPERCAAAALKTMEISFARWCA